MKPDEDEKCNSREYWWPTIRNIADNFEKALIGENNKNSGLIQLDAEKLEEALKMYEIGWWRFKECVYSKRAKEERIDRHKIIAIYTLSFLTKKPFSARIHPENKDKDKERLFLANEYFSLAITLALISAWENKDKIFNMDENEKKWYIIFLNNFKLKLEKINQSPISPDDPDKMVDILSLSQIIYYIEKSYLNRAST